MSLLITTWEGNLEAMDHTPKPKVIARPVILNLLTKPCLSLILEMSLLAEKAKEYERHISPSLRKSTRSWLESINEEFSEDQSSNEGENNSYGIIKKKIKQKRGGKPTQRQGIMLKNKHGSKGLSRIRRTVRFNDRPAFCDTNEDCGE